MAKKIVNRQNWIKAKANDYAHIEITGQESNVGEFNNLVVYLNKREALDFLESLRTEINKLE